LLGVVKDNTTAYLESNALTATGAEVLRRERFESAFAEDAPRPSRRSNRGNTVRSELREPIDRKAATSHCGADAASAGPVGGPARVGRELH
jgi:hypothetical protein